MCFTQLHEAQNHATKMECLKPFNDKPRGIV